ncbi:YphA family membrane protein [Ferdinandcohnia quinoae]|uniref:Uncharacterized protein n=1 Tax=Fredinandcohnia quinoae TaxID=2918902 RepID=A0AAW5DXH2_9BACI|nr:hypothetical protein [Fredinandcohnia sp. SECRCQ15]MCH1624763.1 hypothetical protein [Fredinandcohnia sp. SECRCQ15]
MEGAYFYWISWLAWVICTFFMNKGKQRTNIAILLLLLIILSPHYIDIGNTKLNVNLIIILLFCYKELSVKTMKQQLYIFICVFTISMAYGSFQLFELFDPVWLLFDRKWMFSVILIYITLMIFKDIKSRIIGLLIGAIQGDILFGFVLSKLQFQYVIGSFVFLDVAAISAFIIIMWTGLEELFKHFDLLFQKNSKQKHG